MLKSNLSQLSVSAHSFRAILNLESISARLWGYCASVILANTLDEDLRSWKTVLELPLIDLQSSSHFVASSSEYSSNKFLAISFSFRVLASKSAHRAVCNQGKALNVIRNSLRYGINTKCCMLSSRRFQYTLARDAIRDFVAITYNARGALITYQASFVGLDKN